MFNSVFTLAFSLDHANKDGSDITADQFRAAVLRRLDDVRLVSDDDWFNHVGFPEDTYELEE